MPPGYAPAAASARLVREQAVPRRAPDDICAHRRLGATWPGSAGLVRMEAELTVVAAQRQA
jgi:hypothetical protein